MRLHHQSMSIYESILEPLKPMEYFEAARSCLEKKDYAGYLENARKQHNKTGTMKDKREMERAEKTYSLYKEIQAFLRKENSDYYEILGVPRNATQEEIRSAFNTLVMKFHPDRSKMDESAAVSGMIQKAYLVLGNPEKRKKYDDKLANEKMFNATRFRHAGAGEPMYHAFFNAFHTHRGQGPFEHINQDFYNHLYAHIGDRFGHREASTQEIDGRGIILVILIVFFFLSM